VDVKVVRERLAAAAKVGLAAVEPKLQVFGYEPDAVNPPTFYCSGVTIDYNPERGGGRLIQYTVTGKLLVGKPDDKASAKRLDAIISSGGIRTALEADGTLDGACEDVQVRTVTGYGEHEHAGVPYLGVDVETYVWGFDHA
jgi:hypothetical protein